MTIKEIIKTEGQVGYSEEEYTTVRSKSKDESELGKVLSIKETERTEVCEELYTSDYAGYEIKTEKYNFLILISADQNCCEVWGYFASEDDFDKFIRKNLVSVEVTDTALNTIKVDESDYYEDEDGGIIFVNFKFSDGSVLQFSVYNSHNGYYGHNIKILKQKAEVILDEWV